MREASQGGAIFLCHFAFWDSIFHLPAAYFTPPSLAPTSTRSTLKHIFLLYSSLAFPPKYFGFPAASPDNCVIFARPFLTRKHMAWEKKRMEKKSYYEQLEMWTRIILKAKVSAVMNL